ncbi:colicin E3/pyocin S6 family cytotoxin [Priestia flexa]|uniref:colicin E3/pyocin S6 family cytotoxin n=1 Tax=Priestia flexa TaxID=86664 RepID=UPI0024C05ABC|nr:colicin E3/pyocin S6 family cytotoxin [Priestia flexa]WHX80068.1 colicin E3/pyocin S6 family cytotoxin [Priestia flexa]
MSIVGTKGADKLAKMTKFEQLSGAATKKLNQGAAAINVRTQSALQSLGLNKLDNRLAYPGVGSVKGNGGYQFIERVDGGNGVGMKVRDESGKGTVNTAKDFEKSIVKLPPAERVATVRSKAQEVAKNAGLVKDSKLSKINGRDVYKDPKTGDLYSVDTQHGRFEKTNSKGKHQGEVDFDFMPTKPAGASGGHNLKVK